MTDETSDAVRHALYGALYRLGLWTPDGGIESPEELSAQLDIPLESARALQRLLPPSAALNEPEVLDSSLTRPAGSSDGPPRKDGWASGSLSAGSGSDKEPTECGCAYEDSDWNGQPVRRWFHEPGCPGVLVAGSDPWTEEIFRIRDELEAEAGDGTAVRVEAPAPSGDSDDGWKLSYDEPTGLHIGPGPCDLAEKAEADLAACRDALTTARHEIANADATKWEADFHEVSERLARCRDALTTTTRERELLIARLAEIAEVRAEHDDSHADALGDVLAAVKDEVRTAVRRFPDFNSPHEGWAVIREELDELWEHVRRNSGRGEGAAKEAVQVAAMAIRYVLDLADSQLTSMAPPDEDGAEGGGQ